jgi:hypothetical protein
MAHSKKEHNPQLWPRSAASLDLGVFRDDLEAVFTALADDQPASDTAILRRTDDGSSGARAGPAGSQNTESANNPANASAPHFVLPQQWDQRADRQDAPLQSVPPEVLDPDGRPPQLPASVSPMRLEADGDSSARAATQDSEPSFREEGEEATGPRAAVSVSSVSPERDIESSPGRNIDSSPRAAMGDVQPSLEKEECHRPRKDALAAFLPPVSPEAEAGYPRLVATHQFRGTPSTSKSQAPQLDRLVDELDSALSTQQVDGAFRLEASRTPPSGEESRRAGPRSPEEVRNLADSAPVQRNWSEPERSTPPAASAGVELAFDHQERFPQGPAASVAPTSPDQIDEEEQLGEPLPTPLALRKEPCGAHTQSIRSTGADEVVNRPEDLATAPISSEPGQRGGSLITHLAMSGAVILLLGIGAVWLLPVAGSGSMPTGVVPQEATTIISAGGARYPDEAERRRAAPGDRNELEPPTQAAQMPSTPRLVRTIPIPEQADQPAAPLLGAELSPVGATEEALGVLPPARSTGLGSQSGPAFAAVARHSLSREQRKLDEIAGAAGQQLVEPQVTTVAGGSRWSAAAASNASLAERLRAGEGEAQRQTAPSGAAADPRPEDANSQQTESESRAMAAAVGRAEEPDAPELRAEPAVGTSDERESALGEPIPEADPISEAASGSGDLPAQPTRHAQVTSHVNMRGGPDNDAAVIMVVPAGAEIRVVRCDFWCEVVFEGARGWIYKSFVARTDS